MYAIKQITYTYYAQIMNILLFIGMNIYDFNIYLIIKLYSNKCCMLDIQNLSKK